MSATPNVKKIYNKDVFERINFLHQASMAVSEQNPNLSCFYGSLMKQIQRKAVLKVDPSIKRDFCKRCCKAVSCDTEVTFDEYQNALIECKKCGYRKKYPVK